MNPQRKWYINLLIFVVLIAIAWLLNFILEKGLDASVNAASNAATDLGEAVGQVDDYEIKKKEKDSFIGNRLIEGMEPKKNVKLEVINHYMAGSYNSCFIKTFNFASSDALKVVLKDGIRCLDFEVFMTDNTNKNGGPPKLAVVGNQLTKFDKKKAFDNCKNKTALQKANEAQKPQLTLKEVFNIIASEGYVGSKKNYPIFINLRIKSSKPEIYTVLTKDLKESMLNKKILDPEKYGKCGKFISQIDKNIIYQELLGKELRGRAIIMVEDWCKNYESSDFYTYVHFAAGNNLNSKTNSDLSTKKIPDDEQKNTFSIVKPDDYFQGEKEMTQPSVFNSKSNGINILYWNYLCKKCVNPDSRVANLGNKTDLEREVKKSGFKGFFETNIFLPKPEAQRWKLEKAVSKDIQPKGLACEGTGVCQYMEQDPTKPSRAVFNDMGGGCEKTAKVIYDAKSCAKGKDVIWKKN